MKSALLRRIYAAVLTAALCVCAGSQLSGVAYASTNNVRVVFDGQQMHFDVPAQVINDRTMVPMRAIFAEAGASVQWDAETQTVTATTTSGDIIRMTVGSNEIYTNGLVGTMDAPPAVINGRTLVPARFVAQAMGFDVRWSSSDSTVHIVTPINTAEFERRVFELINIEREKQKLQKLIWDDGLANAARSGSVDQAASYLPGALGADGLTVQDRLDRAGVTMSYGGYAMIYDHKTPEATVAELIKHGSWFISSDTNTHAGVGFHRDLDSLHRFYVNVYFGEDRATLRQLYNYPPLSEFMLPDRILSADELQAWIAEYNAAGSPNHFELEVVELLNRERANKGLHPLTIDPTLMMIARFKSQSMSDIDYMSHTGVYGQPWDLARAFGYSSNSFGENIARGRGMYTSAASVMQGWMDSPGHRDNILREGYYYIGVGVYISEEFGFSWTQMFSSG